jgi:TolB-like protein/Flp pilus assembly protein TadD
MYTDIVGFTSLTQKDESSTLQALERHRSLLRPHFSSHGGREIKTIGDAFLVEFPSALNAVLCAVAVQQTMHDRRVAMGDTVSLRIGIHVGDVIERGNDILGDAVNLASRIEKLAEPGGVCITDEVYKQVRNKSDLPFISLGERTLKSVLAPMELYAVLMPWEQAATRESVSLPRDRIAILPFANMSPDPKDEYFADGMTEEVISTVSGISGFNVISRTSVMGYKGTAKRLKEIGRELEVGSVLEGSFRKAGNRIRVTTQLIDVSSDRHLWAQSYDRNLDDIFDVQSDVAKQVAEALRVRILSPEKERIDRRPTENVEAYTLYLKGIHSPWMKAIEYLKLAFEVDPLFALAYAKAAERYVMVADEMIPSREALPKAKEYAERALLLDDNLAEAHCAKAMIANQYDWDWAEAERSFRRALSLNPSLAEAHLWFSWFHTMMGRFTEAVSEADRACELNPKSPLTFQLCGYNYWVAGEYSRARALEEKSLELAPGNAYACVYLALISLMGGEFEEAVKKADEAGKLSDDSSPRSFETSLHSFRAKVYAVAGAKERARVILEGLLSKKYVGSPSASQIGTIYYLLGEKDKGWEWMQKAFQTRDTALVMLNNEPVQKAAREDPRYLDLLKKLGLD